MGAKSWLGVCCLGLWFLTAGAQEKTEPRWFTDCDKAFEMARKERKPVFVVFRCEH